MKYLIWSALLFAGCAPVAGLGAWSGLVGVGLFLGALAWLGFGQRAEARPQRPGPATAPDADACGAPAPRPPCDGWEHKSCHQGRVSVSCCPKNAKCNFRMTKPFVECGYEECVEGRDPGLCPPRQPITTPAKDEASCQGSWEKACVAGKVAMACIMPVPTNYMGPPRNPSFRTCGEERCTTSRYIEACSPAKTEGATCLAGWTKVCLQGTLSERCLPVTGPRSDASKQVVDCGGGKCVIGGDASACQ